MIDRVKKNNECLIMIPISIFVFLFALFAGCGGSQKGAVSDPVELLKAGKANEAREAAELATLSPEMKAAVIALSYIIEQRHKEATAALRKPLGEYHSMAAATAMLETAKLLPENVLTLSSLSTVETALGAIGLGPSAPAGSKPISSIGPASREIAVLILERIAVIVEAPDSSISSAKLLVLWNGCFHLDGGNFRGKDDAQAWRMFTSIALIAIFADKVFRGEDLTLALLGAAVSVVESNTGIQTAVRCDLASPFDALKKAVAYNRPLLGRLEFAVKDSVGCTRGTYSP